MHPKIRLVVDIATHELQYVTLAALVGNFGFCCIDYTPITPPDNNISHSDDDDIFPWPWQRVSVDGSTTFMAPNLVDG